MKKCDGHNLCAKSCAKLNFDRFFVHSLENSKYWSFPWEIVRAWFREKTL
ncbi:hypothetical protein B296_00039524 [Ensete ventricosum]|uniref:Uncharacterized protein n=1 Tax=Ensete ventricosum TaxID=4639 RepID=A0A426XH14_ENSVE|nr:hypothetical protein B296_00039524 [Ensete ventricosum]